MINRLVAERILTERAVNVDREAAGKQAIQELENMKQETTIEAALQSVKVTEDEFIQFLTMNSIIIASLTDEELKSAYEANLAADKDHHTIASVRHILTHTAPTRSSPNKILKDGSHISFDCFFKPNIHKIRLPECHLNMRNCLETVTPIRIAAEIC